MPIRVAALTFDLFVMYYPYLTFGTIAAHVPYSSLSSKNSGKEGDCKYKYNSLLGKYRKQ